jgi:hypothetical protein
MKPKAAAYGEYDVTGGLRRYLSLVLLQDGAFNILDGKEGATMRDIFLEYVKQQTAAGKEITSSIEGRIVVK